VRQAPLHSWVPCGQLLTQVPFEQVSHCWPHWPQLLRSLDRSTQVPLQAVKPGRQAQVPPLQTWVLSQAWPQVPQLVGLVAVLTQALPLQVVPAQVHWPLTQESPCGQALPQLPQARGSLVVSTQRPLQLVLPVGQTHWPERQLCPGLHWVWQPPQCCGSLVGSAQVGPQTIWFGGQAQLPETQVEPDGQA